jgi:hypothetical protein
MYSTSLDHGLLQQRSVEKDRHQENQDRMADICTRTRATTQRPTTWATRLETSTTTTWGKTTKVSSRQRAEGGAAIILEAELAKATTESTPTTLNSLPATVGILASALVACGSPKTRVTCKISILILTKTCSQTAMPLSSTSTLWSSTSTRMTSLIDKLNNDPNIDTARARKAVENLASPHLARGRAANPAE